MSHILLIGVGPLPFYDSNQLYGFGIRTWQFARPLLAAGHRITMVTCEFGIQRESDLQSVRFLYDVAALGEVEHILLPEPTAKNSGVLLTRIEEILNSHKPDAIVAAGSPIATNLAASVKTELPVWLDMFGDHFTEVQAKSPFITDDEQFDFFHQVLTRVLLRGDRFSVVSDMQKGAAVGQLGLVGRLNRFTLKEDLVAAIPCAVDGCIEPVKQRNVLRGKTVSEHDFILLCSGGFNTWADVDTLFYGIEGAMEKNPDIHCVVTGGKIQGHHEDGYKRFATLISKSQLESKFHLLGWISNDDVAEITMESDLGLNVDLPIYESFLGSRNRILYWMQCGLPSLTTVTTELSRILEANGIAYCVPHGDPRRMTQAILDAAADPAKRKKIAAKARKFVYEYFTFEETAKPLVEWAGSPCKAGDNAERIIRSGQPFSRLDAMLHDWSSLPYLDIQNMSMPKPYRPVIHTRPHGKNWWSRLLGK